MVLGLQEFAIIGLTDILRTLHDEARRTHGRVADGVGKCRLHEFYHHADNMARCAELTIIARGSHLAQYILINITHGVAFVHIEFVDVLHDTKQCAWTLNKESSILHKTAICANIATCVTAVEVFNKGEHITANDAEHLFCLFVLEYRPTQVLVWHITVGIWVVPHA